MSLVSVIRSEMSKLRIPLPADKVYKDECMFSFDSPFSDGGLYVNLVTFKGYGKDYLERDIRSGGKLYLHEKWQQVEVANAAATNEVEPTKLAIGVSGGFITETNYTVVKEHTLVVVNGEERTTIALPSQEIPEFVSNVIQGIIDHDGMKSNMQVASWDADNEKFVSKYATGLVQLNPTGKAIPQDPKLWKDEATGATENLWLNLSTGFIGGGRRNWDGSGGSGSALEHYEATGRQYPLAVKLGTITPHGADVWSYAADEDALVIDPLLAEHLSFWGIDVMKLEKTEKTMGEMEVALNMSYDWTRIMDGEEELELVTGPGLVGLRNIGSSCYMNSVVQAFLAIPEVQERYLLTHEAIVSSAPADPSEDFASQFSKVAVGVLSERYVAPIPTTAAAITADTAAPAMRCVIMGEEGGKVANLEKYVVAPRMFKHLVGKGHPEFSSGRQQDVSEYFQYLLEVIAKSERVSLPRVALPGSPRPVPTPSIFEYHVQERFQCPQSGQVKYSKRGPRTLFNMLDLPVPRDQAVPSDESNSPAGVKRQRLDAGEGKQDGAASAEPTEPEQFIPFAACLQSYLAAESVDMFSPAVGGVVPFSKTQRFESFPRYLMVKVARYYAGANWAQQKIHARIDVPEELDLSPYRATGPQPDEQLVAEDAGAGALTSGGAGGGGAMEVVTAPAEFQYNEEVVAQLMSMGFSENGCRRAAIATSNADAETAMNWIFAHMEDPDFNEAPVLPSTAASVVQVPAAAAAGGAAGGVSADPEAVAMLTSMGYTEEQVSAALNATSNNIER